VGIQHRLRHVYKTNFSAEGSSASEIHPEPVRRLVPRDQDTDSSDGESNLKVATTNKAFWKLNRWVTGFDRTHNFHAYGSYAFPFGKGQAYIQNRPAGYVLEDWELSGSVSRESGTPIGVEASGTSLLGPGSTQFADQVSKSHMYLGGHNNAHPYFDTANFADPLVAEKALDPAAKGRVT